jgi:hypothetical protein
MHLKKHSRAKLLSLLNRLKYYRCLPRLSPPKINLNTFYLAGNYPSSDGRNGFNCRHPAILVCLKPAAFNQLVSIIELGRRYLYTFRIVYNIGEVV